MTAVKATPLTIGVVMVALFAGAVLFALNATHGVPLANRKEVKVAFDDLSGLNEGDDVRIASTRVGYVSDLRLENGTAIAVVQIDDPDTDLYADASGRVADRSALGQKYVNLNPGTTSAGPLVAGQVIPASQNESAQDINQLFDVFDDKTRRASSTALKNLGGGMIGHQGDLHDAVAAAPDILADVSELSEALGADGGSSLVGMIEVADRIGSDLAGRDDEIADLTRQLGETLGAIGADNARPIDESLKRAPAALDSAKTALEALNQPLSDTESAMSRLRPGASALGDATPDLRGVLRESLRPLRRMPGVNEQAVPALRDLTGLVSDARPLANQVIKTGDGAAPPVSVFGRYADEISNYFIQAGDALSHGDAAGNWLRIMLLPGVESVVGTSMPGIVHRNPYPAPGQAANDKARANGGNR